MSSGLSSSASYRTAQQPSERTRDMVTTQQHSAQVWRSDLPVQQGALCTKCQVRYQTTPLVINDIICRWANAWDEVQRRAPTLGGQSSGVTRRRGQAEASRERLCRSGHHTYTVNISGWELPPPRRTSEVLVITLTRRRISEMFSDTLCTNSNSQQTQH